jgi:hypothetical protein
MQLKVNDIVVPVYEKEIKIEIVVDPTGERMPPVTITATGGQLDCYASDVTRTGNIVLHVFGEGAPTQAGGIFEQICRRPPPHVCGTNNEPCNGLPRVGTPGWKNFVGEKKE